MLEECANGARSLVSLLLFGGYTVAASACIGNFRAHRPPVPGSGVASIIARAKLLLAPVSVFNK